MDYWGCVEYLDKIGSEVGFGVKPDLRRITALTDLLGNPQDCYPSIQVTGTNGKSSVSRMIGCILGAHGISTGVYTSPHLQSPRERFLVASADAPHRLEPISKERFAETLTYLVPFFEKVEGDLSESVTYFEVTTAMAYNWMADIPVSAAVFEVGLGGSWDATNLVRSSVAVLTRIAVDHVEFFGTSPVDAAREKVGIIKPGAAVVSEEQQEDVREVIDDVSPETCYLGRDFILTADQRSMSGREVSVRGLHGEYEEVFLNLQGPHQARNFAIAVAASESFLGRALDLEALRAAGNEVRSPGRLETVGSKPAVILDGAHNVAGAASLAAAVKDGARWSRRVLIAGISRGKDHAGIFGALDGLFDDVILTTADHPRAADPRDLSRHVNGGEIVTPLAAAIARGRELAGEVGAVYIAGSIFLAGEARDFLTGPLD